MILGPVFFREASVAPRRPRHYLLRSIYTLSLLILICTAWFVLAGTQIIRNVGDMARFGGALFQVLAPLQLALVTFLSAFGVASAVSQEKDRRTLILLLMTRLSNGELVLGKLLASLLDVLVMLAAAVPVFLLVTLLGGVSHAQVFRVFAVSLTTALLAGSLGSTLALWREKTFQTISMTALVLVLWAALWEVVHAGVLFGEIGGVSCETIAVGMSPIRAILSAASPRVAGLSYWDFFRDGVSLYLVSSLMISVLLNAYAIVKVRVWNPSREVRPGQADEVQADASIWGAEYDIERESGQDADADAVAEQARSSHVDARRRTTTSKTREVWDNPILWREVCTWAYGRKVLLIRVAYWLLFAVAAAALYGTLTAEAASVSGATLRTVVPPAATTLAPFFLVSLVIVNALAVNSITNERDALALDLLLVTDLSPREFVFGKLAGVLWVSREMVLLPLLLCVVMWWNGGIGSENLCFLLGGLAVMNIFAAMLGIHCGMTYANSRTAIGVSMGTVFFLFVGVVTCLVIMISFSGSFHVQYAPFLAFIGGGSVGLYVALGFRNPSTAILWSSLLLPIATFFAIVSFVLGNRELTIFLVVAAMYGFTTLSLVVPAIAEFDIAMGRTKTAAEE